MRFSSFVNNVWPKLIPFFITVTVYFVLFIPQTSPSLWAMAVKCAPIISLMLFVVLQGIGLTDDYRFSRRILIGLVFSSIGDAFLIWQNLFIFGMAAFGLAQVSYIHAFRFDPLKPMTGCCVYVSCGALLLYILPGTKGILTYGLPVYSTLLATMTWRAIARIHWVGSQCSWPELCCSIGAVFFALSDTFIGLQMFSGFGSLQVYIMTTYYIAQLGIALSTVNSKQSTKETNLLCDVDCLKNNKKFT